MRTRRDANNFVFQSLRQEEAEQAVSYITRQQRQNIIDQSPPVRLFYARSLFHFIDLSYRRFTEHALLRRLNEKEFFFYIL